MFQGGVAAYKGIRKAIENELQLPVYVPPHYDVMGAIGAAILAKEKLEREKKKTMFKGFSVSDDEFKSRSFICGGCPNRCEVVCVLENQKAIGYFGDRCGKYNNRSFSSPAVYV